MRRQKRQKPITPWECAQVLAAVEAVWQESPAMAELILAGLGPRALPAALLMLDASFDSAGAAMGVPKETLLAHAHQSLMEATGNPWGQPPERKS